MMSLKASHFIIFLSTLYIGIANSECIEGKIKHTFKNKDVLSKENYCYELESNMLLSSDPCPGDKVCQNKELKPIGIKMSEVSNESGSPGFKICEKYNGIPQVIEFWATDEWHTTSRCIFNDGSFIDNSSLAQNVDYLDQSK